MINKRRISFMWVFGIFVIGCFLFMFSHKAYAASGKLWLTVFANHNNAADGGHAFLCVENKTSQAVYIGPYRLEKGKEVYIGARGDKIEYKNEQTGKKEKPIEEYVGGVWFDFEPVNDKLKKGGVYKNFAWYTIPIKKADLKTIFSEMKSFGKYSFTKNNCATFVRITWNKIAGSDRQIPKYSPDQPYRIMEYIKKKWGAKVANSLKFNDKGKEQAFLVTGDGHLQPFYLNTVKYLNALGSLSAKVKDCETISLSWDKLACEIGKNEKNITSVEVEYRISGEKKAETLSLGASSVNTTINNLQAGKKYEFRIRGISDHRADHGGINRGKWSPVVVATTNTHSAKLPDTFFTLTVGSTIELKPSMLCRRSHTQTITWAWTSNSADVASVSDTGEVTAKKPGTTTITGTVASMKVECEVKVINADANTSTFTFETIGGQTFFLGSSKAAVNFVLDHASTNVLVSFRDSNGTLVFTKEYASCNEGEAYEIIWSGIQSDGTLVPPGQYYVEITAGSITTRSRNQISMQVNPFNGGSGSEEDPFEVASFEQLKHVGEYPNSYFIQTQDIDCGNGALTKSLFGTKALKGQYDGGNHTIRNLNVSAPSTFGDLEAGAVLKNLTLENVFIRGRRAGGFAYTNKGTIASCQLIQFRLEGTPSKDYYNGGICSTNYGKVSYCKVQNGTMDRYGAGLVELNKEGALIEHCILDDVTAYEDDGPNLTFISGGFCNINLGTIDSCTASNLRNVEYVYARDNRAGGVISNCSYSNISEFKKVAEVDKGIIY